MDISKNNYKIVFTNDSIYEMEDVYNYISRKLYATNNAIKLMRQIEDEIFLVKL